VIRSEVQKYSQHFREDTRSTSLCVMKVEELTGGITAMGDGEAADL
jgi:hypothetical protein